MVAVPEQGDLEHTPFPRLLIDLYRAEFSGQVELKRERVEKTLLFDQGVPVFAESNIASESLGVQLMDAGTISRSQYADVVACVERKHCKEGSALLELQLIEPKGLFVALKEQVRSRIVECFGWARGEFRVDPSVQPHDEARPFRANLYALIQQGIADHWRIDRVLVDLEPRMSLFPTRTSRLAAVQSRLECDAAFEAFLNALDGETTFWNALRLATTPGAAAGAWVVDAADVLNYRQTPKLSGDAEITSEIELVLTQAPTEAVAAAPEATAAAREPTDASRALEQEIALKYEQLEDLDHYAMLGVEAAADPTAIRRAYLLAAKTYHPDSLARAEVSGELRERASKVFAAIGKAHSVLSDPNRRLNYDRALTSDGPEIDAEKLANAETLFRKGEILLKQGNFKMALEFLQPAVELWPDEADYQSACGWTLYKKLPSEPALAQEHLQHAMRMAPEDAVVVFRLSVVTRALGDEDTAAELLDRAQSLDPKVSKST